MDERLGRWSFWIMFIGFNVAFFPMHITGITGMPRRIYTYPEGFGWGRLNLLATIGAFVLGIGILVSLWNFLVSARRGAIAGNNPWRADSLEWVTSSPPAPYGTVHIPTVRSRHPLWDDYDEEYDPNGQRILDEGRFTLATTWRDAEPWALAQVPEATISPLLFALGMTAIFTGLIFQLLWLALAGIIVALVMSAIWLWPKSQGETA
jgi:hypothetical protein